MELDRVASERVLDSIRNALPRNITERAEELAELAAAAPGGEVTLKQFLDATGLDLDDVYAGTYAWSDLRERAGLATAPAGEHEATLRRACGRLLHVDDPERLVAWRRWLQRDGPPDVGVSERDDRLLRMLVGQLLDQVADKEMSLRDGAAVLWAHAQVRRELDELLEVLEERVSHLTPDLRILPDVPLHVHARYTRIEILAACGKGEGARGDSVADRRPVRGGAPRRPVRVHAGQERRRVLPHHPLPRLRHQPRPHPLGEPVGHAGGQRDGAAVPGARRAGQPRPACSRG